MCHWFLAGAGRAGAGPSRSVDPARRSRRRALSSHPCLTIGYALGLAPTGATIEVAAGTYPEQLTITKNVTIQGAGRNRTIIEPSSVTSNATDTDSSTTQFAIVYFGPGVTSACNDHEVDRDWIRPDPD
jgi:hypothetical protein